MKNTLLNKIGESFQKIGLKAQKHSPEIFLIAGIGLGIGAAVSACIASMKVTDVLDETKEKVDNIHEQAELNDLPSKEVNAQLTGAYLQTGMAFVKLYGPSVMLGTLSVTCILVSNNILRKRNVALGAAYAAVDKGFKEYRSRVVSRFGEEVDKELRYNMTTKKEETVEVDPETGKEKKVKKEVKVIDPKAISDFADVFYKYQEDEYGNSLPNPYWEANNDYNLMFLRAQEKYANDLLRSKKRVFLNDVRKAIGLPETKAGQMVGWIYEPEKDDDINNDNYIDFGIDWNHIYRYSEDGIDSPILLDFNVYGNIWKLM